MLRQKEKAECFDDLSDMLEEYEEYEDEEYEEEAYSDCERREFAEDFIARTERGSERD